MSKSKPKTHVDLLQDIKGSSQRDTCKYGHFSYCRVLSFSLGFVQMFTVVFWCAESAYEYDFDQTF